MYINAKNFLYAIFIGDNNFNELKIGQDMNIKFTKNSITTVNNFISDGNSLHPTNLLSTSSTTKFNLIKLGGGTIHLKYTNVLNSAASPSSTWYTTGIDLGNTTGWNFVVPSTPYTILSGCTNTNGWNNSNQTITLTCDGNGATCTRTDYRLNSTGTFTHYTTPFVLSVDGNYKIDYYSTNDVPLTETTKTSYCAVDKTAPSVGQTELNGFAINGNYISGSGIISATASDLSSGINTCEYTIDGTNWNSADKNTTHCYKEITIIPGTNYTFRLRTTDYAGNTTTGTSSTTYEGVTDLQAPVTTFKSFQVPNTTDTNITLTCTDNNTGCKAINYNINNEGWNGVFFGDFNWADSIVSYYKLDETSGTTATDELGINNLTHNNGVLINQTGIIRKSAGYDGSNDWTNKANPTGYSGNNQSYNIWVKLNTTATTNKSFLNHGAITGCGVELSGIKLEMKDNDEIHYGLSCSAQSTYYTWTTDWTMVTITAQRIGNDTNVMLYINSNFIASSLETGVTIKLGENFSLGQEYVSGSLGRYFDGLIDEVGTWNKILTQEEINMLYNMVNGLPFGTSNSNSTSGSNSYSFLFSGAGQHSISYFSTDSAENNETIKTSTFTTYGKGRFYFKDENSGSDLTGVQVNFNGTDYDSGANNYLDFNFQTLPSTNTTYLFTLSKTGYSTRYYQTDLNYFSSFDINFALIPDTLDTDIQFKMFPPTGTTTLANTYIEFKDKDTNYTITRLKSNSEGELTANLRSDDQNYLVWISEGTYIYQAVQLTIFYPKDEQTLADITGNWRIEITDNISYQDLNIPQGTNKIIYLLPNTKYPFTIAVQDTAGTYFKRKWSKIYQGNPLTDTLQPYLVNADDGIAVKFVFQDPKRDSIENIIINIYKNVGGVKTLISSGASDVTGNALFFLIAGEKYMLDFTYNGAVIFETQNYSVTSSTVYWTINLATREIKTIDGKFITVGFNPIQDYILKNATNISYKVTASGLNRTRAEFYIIQDGNKIITYTRDAPCTTPCTVTIPIEDLNITLGNKVYLDLNVYIDSNNYIFNYKKTWSYGTTSNIDTHDLFVKARTDFGCTTDTMWPCPLTSIVSIIIMILLIGSMVFTFNFVNPKGLLVAGLGILAVFTYLGWFWWVALVLIVIASIFYLRGD